MRRSEVIKIPKGGFLHDRRAANKQYTVIVYRGCRGVGGKRMKRISMYVPEPIMQMYIEHLRVSQLYYLRLCKYNRLEEF